MSSPSYKSRLDPELKAKMFGWLLSREERVGVWTRLLVELPADPDRHLTEPVRRPNVWAYTFALPGPPRRHFIFSVERRDYSGELIVQSGRLSDEPEE